jgi:superfamily II DNA or RNA helicase
MRCVGVEIIVDNRVNVCGRGLTSVTLEILRHEFEHSNPQHSALRHMGLPTWSEPAIIRTWREDGEWLTFPRGGLARVKDALRRCGLSWAITDSRHEGEGPAMFHYRGPELREHQREAVEIAHARQQCILRAPTAAGKTTTAFALIARVGLNAIVLLPNGALYKQWRKRAASELGIGGDALGEIGGGKFRVRPLTIAMQKSIASLRDRGRLDQLDDYFGMILCDEAQLFAARTFFAAVDPFRAKYRIAVSADERRKDRKEFLVHDLFGEAAHEVKRKTLERRGYVLDVEIRMVPTTFEAPWYDLPEDREDTEHALDFKRLLDEIVVDEARNEAAVEIAINEVRAGEQVLVFSHRREHCQLLQQRLVSRGVSTALLLGGPEYAEQFDHGIEQLGTGHARVAVGTYQAIGTGVDLPTVAVGIATTPIAGNKQFFNQVRGRLSRAPDGKTSARLYYLWDEAVYPSHARNVCAWNSTVVVTGAGGWEPMRRGMYTTRKGAV